MKTKRLTLIVSLFTLPLIAAPGCWLIIWMAPSFCDFPSEGGCDGYMVIHRSLGDQYVGTTNQCTLGTGDTVTVFPGTNCVCGKPLIGYTMLNVCGTNQTPKEWKMLEGFKDYGWLCISSGRPCTSCDVYLSNLGGDPCGK